MAGDCPPSLSALSLSLSQVLENICDAKPSITAILCEKTAILKFLLQRLKVKRFDEVKLYCSEILSILIQVGGRRSIWFR